MLLFFCDENGGVSESGGDGGSNEGCEQVEGKNAKGMVVVLVEVIGINIRGLATEWYTNIDTWL